MIGHMNIGIIGSGNMWASMGRAWATKGHKVLFSFSQDAAKPRAVTEAAGPAARSGAPVEAVAFGDVILLAVPWGAVTEAVKAAGTIKGKVLFTCVNCVKPDLSGLALGTTTSAGLINAGLSSFPKYVLARPRHARALRWWPC